MMVIDGKTHVYGIIGNPVSHSLSPKMHNSAFQHLGINSVYLPFPVLDIAAAAKGLRGLQVYGTSVTIPHKEDVMQYLDRIDPIAEKIGAVNTIKCERKDGDIHLWGYNTDWIGAVRPLKEKINLSNTRVDILGAGGSARAIGFGLLEEGAQITLCSRTEYRGRKLADDLGCDWVSLAEENGLKGEVLINATSVGMTPQHKQSPVSAVLLKNYSVVMDIVYAPLKTQLLKDALEAGCQTINGLEMLLYQGMAQFELWTDLQPPEEVMRKVLLESIAINRLGG